MDFSSCSSWALECWLPSCGAGAQLFYSMSDLPGPGIEPMSPALAGRFFTTEPPEKSLDGFQWGKFSSIIFAEIHLHLEDTFFFSIMM